MKKIGIGIGILLGVLKAFGGPDPEILKAVLESQPSCGIMVRFDDKNLYQGFGAYRLGVEEPRLPLPGKLRVSPLDGSPSFELVTKDAALDVVTVGTTALVLTYSTFEEWDLVSRERKGEYPTFAVRGPLLYKQHAQSMARWGDTLIVAHGRLGVSFFDLKTRRLVNQFRLVQSQAPLESMATAVTIQGDRAYVVMDNFHVTRPGDGVKIFRGFVVIDMKSQTVVSEIPGLDPGADAVVSDGKKVIVSYIGRPLWTFNLSQLVGPGPAEVDYALWQFPTAGHPIGTPAMDDKYYYTCYSKAPAYRGDNGGYYRNVPMVLNRRQLMLD